MSASRFPWGKFLCNQNGYPYCQFVKSGSVPPRACLKIGDVPGDEEFGAAGKQFFRRNPDGFQGKIAPSRGAKGPPIGHVDMFQTSPSGAFFEMSHWAASSGWDTDRRRCGKQLRY